MQMVVFNRSLWKHIRQHPHDNSVMRWLLPHNGRRHHAASCFLNILRQILRCQLQRLQSIRKYANLKRWCQFKSIHSNIKFPRAKRFQTTGTDRPWASSFRMTLFALARSVTNRRADGGLPILLPQESPSSRKIFRMMADVCEAFCLFRVFSGLPKISVHSCAFVVDNQ